MNPSSRDFVNVDMRGLKAALMARARADRVSVSGIVRAAVARYLDAQEGVDSAASTGVDNCPSRDARVRRSFRLAEAEARRLAVDAGTSGLSQTAYLARLINGAPAGSTGANYREQVAALTASTTELAALGQSLFILARQLRQSRDAEALLRHDMLLELSSEVRHHLSLSATVLAALRPTHRDTGQQCARPRSTP